MLAGLTLALKPSVRVLKEDGQPAGLEDAKGRRVRLSTCGAASRTLLGCLAQGESTEETLCQGQGPAEALELRYLLALLEKGGWLCPTLTQGERVRATLEPLTGEFRFQVAIGTGPWRLSRFAWMRRLENGKTALESSLGLGRVVLHDPGMLELVGRLGTPQTLEGLAGPVGLAPALARAFLSLLLTAGAAAPCSPSGHLPEDLDPALRQWEFHDLLFHSRSREGRHAEPAGATYRFRGELTPLPAQKPAGPLPAIPLPGPSLPQPAPSFFGVLDARRSLRVPGVDPITMQQLATFLHHVARIRQVETCAFAPGLGLEVLSKPCSGGGSLHELELYLTVTRCAGLTPGLYHYDAGAHTLEPCPGSDPAVKELVRTAQAAMGQTPPPDILFTVAARVQRVSWKYQSIAYALILKDTGVLYQQMYLVATALGLAPCALGSGDAQVFAQASGLPFFQETSVGEFALSGCGTPH